MAGPPDGLRHLPRGSVIGHLESFALTFGKPTRKARDLVQLTDVGEPSALFAVADDFKSMACQAIGRIEFVGICGVDIDRMHGLPHQRML
jgi:hypothetical protein